MLIYLIESISSGKAFIDKQLAEEYLEEINHNRMFKSYIKPIELITDQFMELTLQPPNSKILSETVTAIVSDWNTIEPRFKLFGGTSGSLKYFTKVKPGTKLQITIKELI